MSGAQWTRSHRVKHTNKRNYRGLQSPAQEARARMFPMVSSSAMKLIFASAAALAFDRTTTTSSAFQVLVPYSLSRSTVAKRHSLPSRPSPWAISSIRCGLREGTMSGEIIFVVVFGHHIDIEDPDACAKRRMSVFRVPAVM